MKTYFSDINNAIKTMHYRYGIGDINEIRQFADGRIELATQGFGMSKRTARGRIQRNGNKSTVFIYRHQLTVTII